MIQADGNCPQFRRVRSPSPCEILTVPILGSTFTRKWSGYSIQYSCTNSKLCGFELDSGRRPMLKTAEF